MQQYRKFLNKPDLGPVMLLLVPISIAIGLWLDGLI